MKKKFSPLILLIFISSFALINDYNPIQEGYRSVKNNKFERGEELTYLVHFGFVNGGEAKVSLDKTLYKVNDRICYRVDVRGKSLGITALTYRVNDLWRSYIDTAAMIPHKFYRSIRENNYKRDEETYFNHLKGTAEVSNVTDTKNIKKQTFKIQKYVQDMVSGYYFLRTLEFDKLQKGDIIEIKGFLQDKSYDFKIRYLGKEKLRTKFGRIHTAVVAPVMPENQLFDGENAIKAWISDDNNRVPLKVEAELLVGSIELDLIKHKGLKHKFRKK